MAVSHKNWELPNSQILLAVIDIECGLDIPVQTASRPITFCGEKVADENTKTCKDLAITFYLEHQNKGNHCETTKDNEIFFEEHNLQ